MFLKMKTAGAKTSTTVLTVYGHSTFLLTQLTGHIL